MSSAPDPDRRAVIVCSHVARGEKPILRAIRDEPLEDADSGWQCHCNDDHADDRAAQVWSVAELVAFDPSLRTWIHSPIGTVLTRDRVGAPWSSS